MAAPTREPHRFTPPPKDIVSEHSTARSEPSLPSDAPNRARPLLSGPKNPRWKGGTWVNSKGYVMVLVGRDHPLATCRAYAPRCRVVCAEHHGPPEPGQAAHHNDGDKQNDTPENLSWQYPSTHGRIHLDSERARKLGKLGGKAAARVRARRAA